MAKHSTTKESGLPLPGTILNDETSLFRRYSRQSSTPMKFVIGAVACVTLVFVGYFAISHMSKYQIQTQNVAREMNGVESVNPISMNNQPQSQPPLQQSPIPPAMSAEKQADDNDQQINKIIQSVQAEIESKQKNKEQNYMDYINKISDTDEMTDQGDKMRPFELSIKQAQPLEAQPNSQSQPITKDKLKTETELIDKYKKLQKELYKEKKRHYKEMTEQYEIHLQEIQQEKERQKKESKTQKETHHQESKKRKQRQNEEYEQKSGDAAAQYDSKKEEIRKEEQRIYDEIANIEKQDHVEQSQEFIQGQQKEYGEFANKYKAAMAQYTKQKQEEKQNLKKQYEDISKQYEEMQAQHKQHKIKKDQLNQQVYADLEKDDEQEEAKHQKKKIEKK